MDETEQLIAKLYDDALNRGDNGFVSDYDSIQIIFKNHEAFPKDYGLVDILFKSRFNTDGELSYPLILHDRERLIERRVLGEIFAKSRDEWTQPDLRHVGD